MSRIMLGVSCLGVFNFVFKLFDIFSELCCSGAATYESDDSTSVEVVCSF